MPLSVLSAQLLVDYSASALYPGAFSSGRSLAQALRSSAGVPVYFLPPHMPPPLALCTLVQAQHVLSTISLSQLPLQFSVCHALLATIAAKEPTFLIRHVLNWPVWLVSAALLLLFVALRLVVPARRRPNQQLGLRAILSQQGGSDMSREPIMSAETTTTDNETVAVVEEMTIMRAGTANR